MGRLWGDPSYYYTFATAADPDGIAILLAQPGTTFDICRDSRSHDLNVDVEIGVCKADDEAKNYEITSIELENGGW